MIFTLEYIRSYMDELDNITGFNSKDIELKVSTRMTATYAYNQMQWDDSKDKENRVLINWRQVWSEAILNCDISEEQIQDIIKHEYCHAWADYGSKQGFGHSGKEFIDRCNMLVCNSTSINPDKEIYVKYDKWLEENRNKQSKSLFRYRKIFDRLMDKVKYIDEVSVRVDTKRTGNDVEVCLNITDKYSDCADIRFLFDNAIKDIEKILNSNVNINIISEMNVVERDGIRKANIKYIHKNAL